MGREEEESEPQPWKGRDRGSISPEFLLLGILGAAAATAVSGQWRRHVDWYYTQLWRSENYFRHVSGSRVPRRNEEAWARYRRRIQEMDEDLSERVERIRCMQEVFNRERNKYKRSPEGWTGHGTGSEWHQQFQKDDWYRRARSQNSNPGTNYQSSYKDDVNYTRSHHYAVLGLDRFRTEPYSDDEIKSAFRKKALEFHPDHNRKNSAVAETKFKEVMASYEAIQIERKRRGC